MTDVMKLAVVLALVISGAFACGGKNKAAQTDTSPTPTMRSAGGAGYGGAMYGGNAYGGGAYGGNRYGMKR